MTKTTVVNRGYVVVDTAGLENKPSNRAGEKAKGESRGSQATGLGGRIDVHGHVEDFKIVASLTDNTLRNYESAPWLRDAIVTADKKISRATESGNLHLGVGYDFGVQNAFATLTGDTTVSNREVTASATWFQRGNQVRTEAVLKIDSRSHLWGTYTFNTDSNLLNSTFYNIKEREGFIIRPFTVPVASAAVKYSIERDGYTIEPSFDLNTQNPYLSVAKRHRNANIKGSYAFTEQYALLEVGYHRDAVDKVLYSDQPLVRGFVKGPLGKKIGHFSIGLLFDKVLYSDQPLVRGFVKGPLGKKIGPFSIGLLFDKAFDV